MPAIYLKIPDFEGPVTDPRYKGWISIESYSLGRTTKAPGAQSSSRAASSPDDSTIRIAKVVDKSSTLFATASSRGKLWPEVVLINDSAPAGNAISVLYMTDVVVASYSSSSSHGNDIPFESVELNYRTITMMSHAEYRVYRGIAAGIRKVASWL